MAGVADFGVQSFCFRHVRDNRDVARLVRQIGVSSVELCGVHADFQDVGGFRRVADIYAEHGVRIVSLGVQVFTGQAARERKLFECAGIAGARHISADFQVGSFHRAVPGAAALAEEFDVRVGIHCHGGWSFGGSPDVLQHLLDLGGPRFGINIDTAWAMQIGPLGGGPVQWVRERFRGRVSGVHFKDVVFDAKAHWSDVVLGAGSLDLPAFVDALQETGFDGMAVLEYEAESEDPTPALKQCVRNLRALTWPAA